LGELESRRTVESVRQYQRALITPPEEMRNPGRLPLYETHKRLLGHERDYIYHLTEEMKRFLPGKERPVSADAKGREAVQGLSFGEIPRESMSYREYIASLGEIERRLLDEALARSGVGKARPSISEPRNILPREEMTRIHNRACSLAWERLATR